MTSGVAQTGCGMRGHSLVWCYVVGRGLPNHGLRSERQNVDLLLMKDAYCEEKKSKAISNRIPNYHNKHLACSVTRSKGTLTLVKGGRLLDDNCSLCVKQALDLSISVAIHNIRGVYRLEYVCNLNISLEKKSHRDNYKEISELF